MKDSKRNMRIDMRPKVVARVMNKEIILFIFAIIAAAGMPIYFLKVHKAKEDYAEKELQKIWDKDDIMTME